MPFKQPKYFQKHANFSEKGYRCLWLCYKLFYPVKKSRVSGLKWPFEQAHFPLKLTKTGYF